MRILLLLLISLTGTIYAQSEPQYVIAIKEQQQMKLRDGSGPPAFDTRLDHVRDDWTLEVGETFPLLRWVSSSERSGGAPDPHNRDYAAVQIDNHTMVLPSSSIRLVEPRDVTVAAMTYRQLVLAHRDNREKQRQAEQKRDQEWRRRNPPKNSTVQPSPNPPTPVAPQAPITVEPLYTWDVKVWIGRKYWATEDKYEVYSSLQTEVQAKTRSEAERIAADRSYTTKSALIGSQITVEPAGTHGAKFRVYNCEATRQ